jgi:hypothetical protein
MFTQQSRRRLRRCLLAAAAALVFAAAANPPPPSADLDCYSILQDGPTCTEQGFLGEWQAQYEDPCGQWGVSSCYPTEAACLEELENGSEVQSLLLYTVDSRCVRN